MKIDRKEFLNILKKCMPGVTDKAGLLEGSDTIVFNEGFVCSYNQIMSTTIQVDALKELSGAVRGKELYEVVNKLRAKELQLSNKKESWIIKCGKARIEFTLLSNSILDMVKKMEADRQEWKKLPLDFIHGVSLCGIPCNKHTAAGIFVNGTDIIGTDAIRIAHYALQDSMPRFWISDESANQLIKMDAFSDYSITGEWVHFKAENTVFSVKRKIDDKYPYEKIKSIIDKHELADDDFKNIFPKEIKEAIDKASIFAGMVGENVVVGIDIKKEFCTVKSSNYAGKYEEKLLFDKAFSDNIDISIGVKPELLKRGFKDSLDFYVKSVIKNTPSVVFTTTQYKHIILTQVKQK